MSKIHSNVNDNLSNRDISYLKNQKYVSIAVIAAIFTILTTLLQMSQEGLNNPTIKTAVLFLSISISYLSFDAFFLNMEKPDGRYEAKSLAIIRIFFWIIGGIGISVAFSYLPNFTNFSTGLIIVFFFLLRFIVMFLVKYNAIKRENKIHSK